MLSRENRNRIKLVVLSTDLIIGGAQWALIRFLELLDRERYKVTVITMVNGGGELASRLHALGVDVIDLEMRPKWRLDRLFRLNRLLKEIDPHIIHGWMVHASFVSRLIGRMRHIPVNLVTRHTNNLGSPGRVVINRWLAHWCDAILAVSSSTRQAELDETGLDPARVVTVPNGLGPEQRIVEISPPIRTRVRAEFGIMDDEILAGAVGRLTPAKGYPDLLEAMALLKEKLPRLKLLIVGDGVLAAELNGQHTALDLGDRVIFAGSRSDVPDLLQGLDFYVLSSHWEGLPIALLEGMAAGLPAVATAVKAVPEIMVDGQHGLIVPTHAPDRLAAGIERLAQDADLRAQLGRCGRERVLAHFTLEKSVEITTDLYERLLNEKGVSL